MIVLDTHAAIWFTMADAALGKQSELIARQALTEGRLVVSAITFWEIALLTAKGRLEGVQSSERTKGPILSGGILELPLTGDIAVLAVELQNLHADPADRFIAATAIAHNATLMTADNRLLKWRHKLKRQDASK